MSGRTRRSTRSRHALSGDLAATVLAIHAALADGDVTVWSNAAGDVLWAVEADPAQRCATDTPIGCYRLGVPASDIEDDLRAVRSTYAGGAILLD
ncbi:MAG TPA: hypothetical protein VFS55_08475 [Dokdonella sp.]|nr:hypothetical protein [Dokdonella sp.]